MQMDRFLRSPSHTYKHIKTMQLSGGFISFVWGEKVEKEGRKGGGRRKEEIEEEKGGLGGNKRS